jgi:putative glutamine amidotransferase
MLDLDKPVLGICGGEQLLNVILGGTLVQHIEDEITGNVLHEQPNPRDEPGHLVKVTPGTLLHKLTGADSLAVNSAHHQAVKEVGPEVAVNAIQMA